MSEIEQDKKILNEGRKNTLKDSDEVQIVASVRDQIVKDLVTELEDQKIGMKVVDVWHQANAERGEYLERQQVFLQDLEEFIEPIYPQATDWASTIHLPTTLTITKTFHARFYSAIMGQDPPFNVRARKAANVDRAMLVEEIMRYAIRDWANYHKGIEDEIDSWVWDWVAKGDAYLKTRWHKHFVKYKDVDEQQVLDVEIDEQGNEIPVVKAVEVEVDRVIEKFNGPMIERIPIEDIVCVGNPDPQEADYVIQACWYTASELWMLVDQKIFRRDAVEKVIRAGEVKKVADQTGGLKIQEHEVSASGNVDKEHDKERYKIYEAHLRVDVDGSGIDSDVIVWVDHQTKEILRATYLHRVMKTGLRPFHRIEFHRRNGAEHPMGLCEMLYSLSKEIDAMHNIRIDTGILTSLPWGFYRPTASSMKEEKLPVEPGAMIPLDNPQTDVFFPNLGNRTSFGFNEEAALMSQVERLTSISDLSLGIVAGQGATRTATGTRALIGEANANLDIYLRRLNRGWKSCLKYLFHMLQDKTPEGLEYRITGDNGMVNYRVITSRKDLQGMYDFEVEGNSANSNKQMQLEQANMVIQMSSNPLFLQLGIISPKEVYEALKNLYKVNGIKDVSKYLREPTQIPTLLSPIEIADRVLAGVDVPLDPTQDLQGFLALVQEIIKTEELNGQFDQFELAALMAKAQEAQGLIASLQAAQAQTASIQQQRLNGQATQTPGQMQEVGVTQAPSNPGVAQ